MGVSIALVCHHWEVLVDAGILKKERQGQLRVCTLDTDRIRAAASDWSGGGGEAGRAPAKLGLPVKAAKRPKPAKARAKPSKR
jgi:DNA-binding transcriptional ArsR family regulator